MVRIGHSVIYFYMVRIGHSVFYFYMVRNGHSCNSISKMATEQYYIWYEMVMVQNTYGTKSGNGFWLWYEITILWYEMVNYGTKWQWYEMVMVRND